jgi:DNA-binding NtrC family response regulator/TolB-like protein/Tfp pilus assembly protein PilF
MVQLPDLVGHSPGISAVRAQVGRLLQHEKSARRLPPILILGETGTGKGLLAQAVHHASTRASGPFVPVNCAAIPETLVEAELFGFERGAFTDARQSKQGLFQSANGGILFLDEIGAIPLSLQAKLLTAMEERTIRRLGSTRSEPLDVWILAATSEDLPGAIRERRFREDLYHRLAAIEILLPPLRERGADITMLAEHFLSRRCAEYGLPPKRLTPDARVALQAHAWPGNVRELNNLMERVAVLVEGTSVAGTDLDIRGRATAPANGVLAPKDVDRPLRESVGDFERSQLIAALESSGGNLSRAAALLGVPRNTLRYRLEKHGLRPDTPRSIVGKVTRRTEPGAARRPVAFLLAALASPQAALSPSQAGEALSLVLNKVHAFGGVPAAIGATRVVAVYPSEPADGASRAVHTVLSIQRAVSETAGSMPISTRAAIHVTACRTDPGAPGEPLHPDDQAEAVAAVDRLAAEIAPDTMLVSQSAIPFVTGQLGGLRGGVAGVEHPPLGSGLVFRTSPVPYRPSIAVLPFRDLSGDPQQEYFGDGITEDIIAALSRIHWLFVISRTSTLVYKSRIADTRQIAKELDVRYVVTGTVRKVASQLRVTADLIDATGGNTIWAEHYDGVLADVFDFQDRITARIVGALESTLRTTEARRALQKHSESLDAYDCVLRAFALLYRLYNDEFLQAGELLAKAIALDPGFAAAYTWRAWWYLWKFGQGWMTNPESEIQEASRLAQAALDRDPDDALALAISAHLASFFHKDCQRALELFERSLALNPNSQQAWGLSGITLCYVGEAKAALDREAYALRLSPFDPLGFYYTGVSGLAAMLCGKYDEALAFGLKSRRENPRWSVNLRFLAATLVHLDRLEEARQMAREFLTIDRTFTLSAFRRWYPLREPELSTYIGALRQAGLPE